MSLNDWKQKGSHFDFEGNSIFCKTESSDKEALLCLHGFPTSSYDYHKIWDSLAERFSLVAFDMIGYGFSDKPADFDYTTFRQADVLQAFIRETGIGKFHILSHDYGNTIIQELLARDEEGKLDFEIASVCMMNGALFPETHRPILAQKILISPIGFLFNRLVTEKRMKTSLASVFGKETQPTDRELGEFLEIFRSNGGDKIAYKLIQYMRERERYRERWVGGLERLKKPFRMINGLEDRVSGAHLVTRFREIMPHEDIIELPNIGHFPHFEAPEVTLKHFFDFHDKIRQAA
ncbi:MAG: alpha/beta hydrolase [Pyrinomonadaceae bacterium]|nr:alpha/beta hydrolase [Pyrinomonadaceae bacterium]